MKRERFETGQALILIVFAIVGLVGLTGLAVDGGMAYGDRRQAQNAADSAAWAAALAAIRGGDAISIAQGLAANNGYDNLTNNTVQVSITNTPNGACGAPSALGKDITVKITSHLRTYFAPVVGIQQLTNTVQAITRACDSYIAPLFPGNAIVALAPSGIGFDARGNPGWNVIGGGIFSNSPSSPSVSCKGAAQVQTPSLTAVGSIDCTNSGGLKDPGATPISLSQYLNDLPKVPACDGTAQHVGGFWAVQSGADGSKVAFGGNQQFAPGLYCVTNSPGPYHGSISGAGVTFYLMPPNFSIKFNGGGGFSASAPEGTGSIYDGVLMFSAPQISGGTLLNTQSIDLRGNGSGAVSTGSIIVPSASVTMFGNSGTSAPLRTQVIAYNVDSGGTADISVKYDTTQLYQVAHSALLRLIR